MTETSSIEMTPKQLLIEERAGKPLRDILVEAYDASGGNMARAGQLILERYGVSVSEARLGAWARQVGLRRALLPSEPAGSASR